MVVMVELLASSDVCLLSNVSMLAIKCRFACCQIWICLLSNVDLLAVK